jgi:hypothetical protein
MEICVARANLKHARFEILVKDKNNKNSSNVTWLVHNLNIIVWEQDIEAQIASEQGVSRWAFWRNLK